jgi:predicted phosphate transport protein (TIGR00153 family)
MSLKDLFKRKPDKFLILLVRQTTLTIQGLDLLKDYLKKRNRDIARQIAAIEQEADEVRRILIEELMRTFITPFDREDIFSLSREIDDILDYTNTTVEEMEILDVKPNSYMLRMASLLYDAAVEINLAVLRLQDNHLTVANEHAQRAKSLENRVETVYREAIADLFAKAKDVKQVVEMMKVRELYRHLSNAADRGDGAANVLSDVIMKMS